MELTLGTKEYTLTKNCKYCNPKVQSISAVHCMEILNSPDVDSRLPQGQMHLVENLGVEFFPFANELMDRGQGHLSVSYETMNF